MARIVILPDIQLSPTHGFFCENWCVARESADAAARHDSDCGQTDTEEILLDCGAIRRWSYAAE
jgi:hypothetical protein